MRQVYEGTVTSTFRVYEYDMEDGTSKYDWRAGNGAEVDELFDSLPEAVQNARSVLGD